MCYTTAGLELTRVSVVDMDLQPVYEAIVLPPRPIVDYNTRFTTVFVCVCEREREESECVCVLQVQWADGRRLCLRDGVSGGGAGEDAGHGVC